MATFNLRFLGRDRTRFRVLSQAVLLLAMCLSLLPFPAQAQGGSKLSIKEISVFNDIPVYKDDIGVGNPPLIKNPVWTSGGRNEPFGYVSTDTPTLTVKFSVKVLPKANNPVTIQGDCELGTFQKAGVVLPVNGGDLTVDNIQPPAFAKPQTAVYKPLTIKWSYKDANNQVFPIQNTTHTVYFTFKGRVAGTKVFLTTLVLAVADGGANSELQAFNNSWAKFSVGNKGPANVTNWNGAVLAYYPAGVGFGSCAFDERRLLRTGQGQCGSFAHLLINVLAVNGLGSDFTTVDAKDGLDFLVKDWTFGAPSFPLAPAFKWQIAFNTKAIDDGDLMVPPQPGGVYGDLTSLNTLAGQNSAPPSEKVFIRHFIVKFTTGIDCTKDPCYFDPSYGVNYMDANDFENKAVDGYMDDFGDGKGLFRVEKSAGLKNIKFNK